MYGKLDLYQRIAGYPRFRHNRSFNLDIYLYYTLHVAFSQTITGNVSGVIMYSIAPFPLTAQRVLLLTTTVNLIRNLDQIVKALINCNCVYFQFYGLLLVLLCDPCDTKCRVY